MRSLPEDQDPLPAPDFCNSWGEGNPVLGKGALGNSFTNHMYYTGGDRTQMVNKVQRMLLSLKYEVGPAGPDGKFGDDTEAGLVAFQQDSSDWEGNPLDADGLVGPRTADALNRRMVGIWYDVYRTPAKLFPEVALVTAVIAALDASIPVEITSERCIRLVISDADPATLEARQKNPQPLHYYKPDSIPPPTEAS